MVDRHGPRRMVVVVTVAFGLATLYMGFVRNAVMLLTGFWMMRMLGQGSLSMLGSNVMNRWWVRRRGAVLGGVGVLIFYLGGLVPALFLVLIKALGWRQSYGALALIVVAIMLPVGLGLYRRQPEDYGLHPTAWPSRWATNGDAAALSRSTLPGGRRCTAPRSGSRAWAWAPSRCSARGYNSTW